jgi:hypothetical protein
MPLFVTIGYGDEEGYERTDPVLREQAHAHDEHLRALGAHVGIADTPVQVRNHDAREVRTTSGPFMRASLPVAGFGIIEAASLAEAVELVAGTPGAVARGVVEVWPLRGS